MSRRSAPLCALLCLGVAWAADNHVAAQPAVKGTEGSTRQPDLVAAKPRIDFAHSPLSFEPNRGQAEADTNFIAHTKDGAIKLHPTGATFKFRLKDKTSETLHLELENSNLKPTVTGQSVLPGKADYFPTGDPKTWITDVPTYSRVHYSGVYPGVDLSFYGSAQRLEYDFRVQPGHDPKQVKMLLSGVGTPSLNASGNLVFKDVEILKPVAYQFNDKGARSLINARFQLSRNSRGEWETAFHLGKYDHDRTLIIDPVVDALSYSEYLSAAYASAVTVDGSGNAYVASSGQYSTSAFTVTKFGPTGTQIFSAQFGGGNGQGFPYAIAVDSSGNSYVTGQIYTSGATVPATSNAYQTAPGTANQEAFLAEVSANGSSLPYFTYLSGSDNAESAGIAIAVDSNSKVYIGGNTNSSSFPTTTGAFQTANPSPLEIGFVSKFDPTKSGTASLVYSTLLGSTTNSGQGQQVNRLAVDYAGNAYAASQGGPGFPITTGALQYSGLQSANGGAYVTKLNSTGTALIYSAYLGYGGASGIAIDNVSSGNPSAYVAGWIYGGGEDFPTTAGAYQIAYASGFAVKMSGDGSTELYSTFLSGPSGYNAAAVDAYPTLAVPLGCTGSCNAYITGRTNSSDWPLTNPIQSTPANGPDSAFITELNSTGTTALFSTYLSGVNAQVYRTNDSQSFGITPAIAVDSTGNMYVAGNTTSQAQSSDFPTTIAYPNGGSQAFLAKISGSATSGFTLAQPPSIAFGNQEVGTTSPISTIRLNNYSGAAVTGLTIAASPNVFAESDNCGGTIVAGGYCSLNVTFTPNTPYARSGALTITSSASNSPLSVALSGSGSDGEYLQPAVNGLTFGAQNVGTTSAAQTFTITNIGDFSTSTNIYSSIPQFNTLNNCPPQLQPGQSCQITVTFSPSQPGVYQSTIVISAPSTTGPNSSISVTGSGVVAGSPTQLTLSNSSLQFGPQPANSTSGTETFYLTNTSNEPLVVSSVAATGPFNITYQGCGTAPFPISPQQTCQVNVTFSPVTTGAANGAITFVDTAAGSPQSVSLIGTGQASTQVVEFYPSSSVSFPDTPAGSSSAVQTIYIENTGTSSMTISRAVVSSGFTLNYSNCEGTQISGANPDGWGNEGYCQVNVVFTPSASATGSQTGTLTFYDSAPGSPHVVNLQGNAITATGTIGATPSETNFGAQLQGVTSSGYQYVYVQNPGNTPVTVTGASFTGTNPADFSATGSNCGTYPFTLQPLQTNCYVSLQFTPTATGSRTATFVVASSAGNASATVLGTGETATQAIELIPTSLNLGSIVVGQSGNYEGMYLYNAGTETVNFTANPTITGTNAADFSLSGSCAGIGNTLAPGASCNYNVQVTPSATGSRSATLTFTDSAGTQTFALSATGVSSTPNYTTEFHAFSFATQLVGSTSPLQYYTYFYNNTSSPITLGNISLAGPFQLPHGYDNCSGQTIAANANCYIYVSFAPTSAGYSTGTLTFNNSSNSALSGVPALPLTGYAVNQTYSAYLNPTNNKFVVFQVVGTTSGVQTAYLYNSGNTPLTVGTVTGTDFGTASSTAEFSISSSNSGYDGCSGQTVQPGNQCQVNITFTPNAIGARSGTINFPVTYANNSTATISGTLAGTGVAEKNSAVLTPPNGSFVDQVVGVTTNYNVTTYLNNSGNQPFTVGNLTNTNSAEFSTLGSVGGYDGCSGVVVQPGGTCQINVRFTPSATGTRSGVIGFPVTFADHTTSTPTFSMMGTGVAASKNITITPSSVNFSTEIQTVTAGAVGVSVINTGNNPFAIGTDSISTNSAEFAISYDACAGVTLSPNQSCQINVTFTPGSSSTGTRTGVLKIGDNATGGPHTVPLSGIAITAAQQILVSPSTLSFGNQPAGSTSSVQTFYVTNQGDSYVTINGITSPAGTNAPSYSIQASQCGGGLGGHSFCYVNVIFSPASNASGSQTASITETDSSSTPTHTVSLTGTAVAPGPAVSLTPGSIAFAQQNVGSTSTAQNFSVTNTGSANLTIISISSTNTTEFPIATDGCSGVTLSQGQHCVSSVAFSPSLGGARSGSIKVTDNATGSPQSLTLTGTGYGIPQATYTPTSLSFTSTNINASSASQTITLKNSGTDTLTGISVAITGGNANQFTQTNTCAATVSPAASCVITVTFKPTAAGSQSAYITVTDNANNIAGSTQSTPISGTGVAVPTGAASPTSLTFSSTNIGVTTAAQTTTFSNSGTGPLTISSIAIGGTNPGDFAQTNNCGSTLVNGSSCTISVMFKPTASGSRTATVTVTNNANNTSGSTQTITLTGTGAGLPQAAVSPSSLTFTNQNVSSTSAAQTITLSNSGTGPLTIASIALSGTNPGDFATTNNCAGSVAASGSCTIQVTFKPTAPGSRTATLTVTDNAGNVSGSTQSASLSGTGVGVPAVTPAPSSLSFTSTNVGSTSSAQSVTLTNGGTGAVTISSITITGANAGDFASTNTCAGSVAAGGSCGISVTFTPTAAGSRSATLNINDNAGNTASTQTVALSGNAAGIPSATLNPASAAFGNQNVGTSSGSKTVTLTNSGSSALTIASIAISGTNAGDFASTNNCGSSVAAGGSCSIAITFTPAAVGSRSATLTVTDNAGGTSGSTQTVSLTGTGVGVAAAAASPNTLVFSNQNVSTASTAQSITLTNSGSAALTVASIAASGTNASDFAVSNTCNGSVAAGGSCAISVTFTPGGVGTRTASVVITDNANNTSGSTQSVALNGTGVGVPNAGVSPTSLTYASTAIGTSAAAQNVTVSNTGSGALSISQIVIGGSNPGDFSDTSTCGATLNAGATCSIAVTFTPTATGTRTGNLHIIDNSGNTGSTQSVTLTGTGSPANTGSPTAGLAPTSLTFQTQTDGVTSAAQSITLSNTGTTALSISSIAISGTNATDFAQTNNCGSSLAVNGTCSIAVTFDPSAAGSRSATLTVTDNSGNVAGSTQTANLSGTGAASATLSVVSLSPSSGSGTSQTFTGVYADSSGTSDFKSVIMLFNTAVNGANACYVFYYPGKNALYLENDANSSALGPITPGSASSLSNSQCTLSGSGTTVSLSGDNVTVAFAVSFTTSFAGQKNVYLNATNASTNTGWIQKGTWTTTAASGPPAVVSVTPNSGSGTAQVFSAVYSDPMGVSDFTHVQFLMNTAINGANACYVMYYPTKNTLYLENDANTAALGPITAGSSATLSNSQCTLSAANTSMTTSGTNMTVTFGLTFSGTFTTGVNVYLSANSSTQSSGWSKEGTWTP